MKNKANFITMLLLLFTLYAGMALAADTAPADTTPATDTTAPADTTPATDTAPVATDTATPATDTATPATDTTAPVATDTATPTADTATPTADTATPTADTAPVAEVATDVAQMPTGVLATAIAKQIELAPDTLNMQAPTGYLGIPGAPQTNVLVAFAWALWVGWIFSTVGAFGGVMAGVGHMSIYGLGNYAKSMGDTSLNKMVTDSVRASNQMLVGLSAAISTLSYYRLKRVVLPLGITLGLGSIAGAFLSGKFTAGKISFSDYQGFFGLFVLVLGCYLFWETSPAGQRSKAKAKAASKAFEASMKTKTSSPVQHSGVQISKISLTRCNFTFCGVEFSFNPLVPFVVGFAISTVATFLGVGGGFLLVPFLTSVTQLPMYLAAGTSAIAVLIGMITGITTLMLHGTLVDWTLVSTQLIGIVIGSLIGPYTSRFFKEIWLKRIFIALALYIGINYVARGFFDYRILG